MRAEIHRGSSVLIKSVVAEMAKAGGPLRCVDALTAKAMADDRQQCLAAGANDYISKPIDVDKLLSLVRVWMPR